MFLSIESIITAIEVLGEVHPFYATTFLACKGEQLPVGRSIPFAISDIETGLLRKYYQTDRSSSYFYTAFVTPSHRKRWIPLKKYSSSTLQSTRTRSKFKDAFIHEPGSQKWGWHSHYKSILIDNLRENKGGLSGKPIPALSLAIWIYREVDWGENPHPADPIQKLLSEFGIADQELELFDLTIPENKFSTDLFTTNRFSTSELRKVIGDPPDAKPESSGLLGSLNIRGVGPANTIDFQPGSRLNLLTGDNGLGKTFLLESAWWALTGEWTDENAVAQPSIILPKDEPRIKFRISTDSSPSAESSFRYDWRNGDWVGNRRRNNLPGLTIYARVDGSYAIWDPTATLASDVSRSERGPTSVQQQIVLNNREVFEGSSSSEGLIRDWVKWQNRPDRYPFAELCRLLEILSPPDMPALTPGAIQRSLFSHLEVPTITHPYGDVPVKHASAGIRRILSLAYLIVWAWTEHRSISERMREEPQRRMVVLIDEIEAHLHPQWQRTILPALLTVGKALDADIKTQFVISTHSPMVMASAEPVFDDNVDKQFHLEMSETGQVSFEEKDFVEYGLIDYWLVSPTFDLKHPSNVVAEGLIEEAKQLQLQDHPDISEVKRLTAALSAVLPSTDPFWARWVFFAERYDVEV